jgi:hypothetical protein
VSVNKLLVIVAALTTLASCDGGFCNDSEGLGPGLIVLRNDGFVIPTVYGALGSTPERVFPYDEESPFLKCRAIGTLSVRHPEAVLDSDHYPQLESLGGIGVEVEDGGQAAIDDISGFDSVLSFGSIGNPFGDSASIRIISGFNAVERVSGTLDSSAVISGFNSLTEIDGSLEVSAVPGLGQLQRIGGTFSSVSRVEVIDLPYLYEVGGTLSIERSTLQELGFPALTHVGGNVDILSNDYLERWTGMALRAEIGGHFLARNNNPVRDEVFEQWLLDSETVVVGEIKICGNRPIDEPVGEEICTGF